MTKFQEYLFTYGNSSSLASMLGITRQSVHFWKVAGFVPARFANKVSSITGIPVSELLPTGIKNE
jgi:hypothetical protein